jgi:hypothetical protein
LASIENSYLFRVKTTCPVLIEHFFEAYMRNIITAIILMAISNTSFAKEPTSKHCLKLNKEYRHAVRTNNPIKHKLAERLWVECGK